jgi:YjjG family noncanonical pyrimidine nucleotidase
MMAYRMRTFRGFLLDADNTLLDYDRAEREAFLEAAAPALAGVPPEEAHAAYSRINSEHWARFERGAITAGELKAGRFRVLLDSFGLRSDEAAVAALSARYLAALSGRAFFLPHAREVLEELSRRAVLCLITNGLTLVQKGRIRKAGIGPFFRAVLISEELGLAKPDPRFFLRAAEATGLPASELLCVGDNPSADIGGARAAGIAGCWYNPAGAPWPGPGDLPERVIGDLRELPELAPP